MRSLVFFLLIALLAGCSRPSVPERKIKFYQSPMHPWITSDKPGNCTICGMQLVPVYEGQEANAAAKDVISLNRDSLSVLNVATVPVRQIELTKSLRFSGILEDDENIHRVIAAFYDGRIDQVYVEHVGQYVEKGQPLAAIYSPELLYIVREYQNAVRGGNQAVARNAAQRLVQYGLGPEQVAAMGRLPDTVYTIELQAPISGTVVTKKAYKGQYIKTGEPLFEMGDLSRLWFHAEVYERDLPDIRVGQKAVLRTSTVPGRTFEGVVTFIDPNFDPQTRSTKVRVEVDNPSVEGEVHGLRRMLPHRAYAEADIRADLGKVYVVPRAAVLQDGRRAVVYVEKTPGQYEPRLVRVGRVGDEGVEILSGLAEGEKVVTEGNLMIDAEAQLRNIPFKESTVPSTSQGDAPPSQAVMDFLDQLARVSDALAMDDSVAAIKAGQDLPRLASVLPGSGDLAPLVERLKALPAAPRGSDLKALRQSFLPWSTEGAALDLALLRAGRETKVSVFECPMTGDSFPGAPPQARWVQFGGEVRNPYLGREMLNCGIPIEK